MKKIYIETSIVSYYTSRPSRDLVIAARQEITRQAWPLLESNFDLYISALVIQEVKRGDKEAAQKRLDVISGIPIIKISDSFNILYITIFYFPNINFISSFIDLKYVICFSSIYSC